MKIVKRTMGWINKPSAWEHQQSLNARRRAHARANLNQHSLLANGLFAAQDTFNHDMTALVLKSTVNRISSQAEARVKAALPDDLLNRLGAKLDKTA